MIPNYRIMTYSKYGLTDAFKTYLNSGSQRDQNRKNKDVIAQILLNLFYESNLAFCGTCVSWSKEESFINLIALEKLTKIRCLFGGESVSIEGIIIKYDDTYIGMHGFYPLSDIPMSEIESEYEKVSFLKNDSRVREILNHVYSNVLQGVIAESDKEGIIVCILANESEIADLKSTEIIDLISDS